MSKLSLRSICYVTTALVLPSTLALTSLRTPAQAADLLVTNFTDASVVGQLSLRDAIAQAQPGDVIKLTAGAPTTITLGTMLTLDKSVTIEGSGNVTVSGHNATRVLTVDPGAEGSVTLRGFTISDGRAWGLDGADATGSSGGGGGGAGLGGGLFVNSGSVTLDGVLFVDNEAAGGAGGTGGGGLNGTGGAGGRGYAPTAPTGPQSPAPGAGGATHADGGDGEFGAGGGGGGGSARMQSDPDQGGDGGRGGFGAGGGGGGGGTTWTTMEPSPVAGFYPVYHNTVGYAGGSDFGGGAGASNGGGGGGGAGLGGAVFVRQGANIILKGDISYSGGTVAGGNGAGGGASAIGEALFLAGGASIDVAIAQTQTIDETIGGGSNSLITGGVTKTGEGVLVLGGNNSYYGATDVEAGTLRVDNGNAITDGSAVTVAQGATLDLIDDETIGSLAGAGQVTLNTHTLTTGRNGGSEFGGVVSGSGELEVVGGRLTLTGANVHTGGTAMNGGTVVVGADVNLGELHHGISFDGGTLSYSSGFDTDRATTLNAGGGGVDTNANDATWSGTVSGAGSLRKTGDGALTLSGTNSYAGGTVLQGGVVHVASDDNLGGAGGALTFTGGTLRLGAGMTSGRTVSLQTGAVDTNGFDATLSGTIGDYYYGYSSDPYAKGELTKTGEGTLTLTGHNTYRGGTTIEGGAVRVGADDNLGAYAGNSGALTLDGGALRFDHGFATGRNVSIGDGDGAIDTAGHDVDWTGTMSGAGRLTKSGAGTVTLSGVSSHAGGTAVEGGALRLGASDILSDAGGISVASGAVFDLQGHADTVGALSGGGSIALGDGALTTNAATDSVFSGAISGTGSLTKTGAGTLTLSGVAAHSGGTAVNGGVLRLGASDVLADAGALSVASGATLDLDGRTETVGVISGAGGIALGAGALTTDAGGDSTFSGAVSGTGSLTKAGAGMLTLAGGSTHSGGTTVEAGTLRLGAAGALAGGADLQVTNGAVFDAHGFSATIGALTGAGDVTLGAGTLTLGDASDFAFDGAISGSGGLTKSGSGTATLKGANTYTGTTAVAGGRLRLGAPGALAGNGSVSVAQGAAFDVNGMTQTIGGLSGAGEVALGAGALTVANADDGAFSGSISGSGRLVKTAAGTLSLTGASTHSGGVAVVEGTLSVAGDAALGTGALALEGGVLRYGSGFASDRAIALGGGSLDTNDHDATLSGVLTGSGGLTKTGEGTLTLTGVANTYAGDTVVAGGTLAVGDDASLGGGNLALHGGALRYTAAFDTARAVALDGGVLDTNGFDATLSGIVSGAHGLTKKGEGTLTLTGKNSYAGGATVAGGTLSVGADNNLGGAGGLELGDATLRVSDGFASARQVALTGEATIDTAGNDLTLSGTVSGAGALTKAGAGALTLSGANAHAGGTVVSEGVLVVSSDENLGQAGTGATGRLTFDGGALRILDAFTVHRDVTLGAAGGTVDTNGHRLDFAQTVDGEGGLTKVGAGDLILSGVYTFRGGTRVIEGSVLFEGTDQLPTDTPVAVDSGTFDLNGNNQEIGALSGAGGEIALTDATLTINQSGDATFAGRISGAGGLVKRGTGALVLSGPSSHSGPTEIQAGTLRAGADFAFSSASRYVVATGATLDVGSTTQEIGSLAGAGAVALADGSLSLGGDGASTEFGGSITGDGELVKTGDGLLNLTGSNPFIGLTIVNDGTMAVNGTLGGAVQVVSGGTLAGLGAIRGSLSVGAGSVLSPGNSPGVLTVSGPVTLGAGSRFEVDVDGPGGGGGAGGYDRLLVTGAGNGFTAGGSLAPKLRGITGPANNSFTPALGDRFRIVEAEGGVSGSFSDLTQPVAGLPAGTRFDVVYGPQMIDLHLAPQDYADLAAAGESQNAVQIAMGRIVDTLRPAAGTLPSATVKPLFDILYVQDGDGIRSVLDQLAGRGHADASMTALANARTARQALDERLGLAQGGAEAVEGAAPSRVWGKMVGSRTNVGDDGDPGRDVTTAGALVGVDGRLEDGPLVGAALGFVRGKAGSTGPDAATVESYSLFGYGRYDIGATSIAASAGYAYGRYDVERSFAGTVSGGETGGHVGSVAATVSHELRFGDVSLIPAAGMTYDAAYRGSVREAGLIGLEIESDVVQSLTTSFGVRVRGNGLELGEGVVIEPELRAAWEHEYADTNAASRAGLAGISFAVENADVGRDAAVLGAGVSLEVSDQTSFYADYGVVLRRNETRHSVSAGLRIRW